MTDEEKAEVFIKRHWGHYGEDFRNAMVPPLVKLIRDEREESAKICEEMIAPVTEDHPTSRHNNPYASQARHCSAIRNLPNS